MRSKGKQFNITVLWSLIVLGDIDSSRDSECRRGLGYLSSLSYRVTAEWRQAEKHVAHDEKRRTLVAVPDSTLAP